MKVGRREPCTKCGMPVFIAERLLVGGHLYHRTCFRCARCQTQLSVANCYETEGGEYCCETCPDEVLADKENHPTQNELDMIGHAGPEDEYSAEFESAMENSTVSQIKSTPKFSKAQTDFMSSQLTVESSRNSFHSDIEEKGLAASPQLDRTKISSSLPLRSTESPVKDYHTGSSKNVNKLVEDSSVVSSSSSREGGVSVLTKYFSRQSDISQIAQSSENSGNDSKKDVPISASSKTVNTSVDKISTANNSTSFVNSQATGTKDSDSDEFPATNIVKARMQMFEKNTSVDDKDTKMQSNKRFSMNQRNSSNEDETKHINNAALKDLMQKDDNISKDDQGKPIDKITIITSEEDQLFEGIYEDSVKTESHINFDDLSADDTVIRKDTLEFDKSDTPKAVTPVARSLESEMQTSSSSELVEKSQEVTYPKDLNPFGDDVDDNEKRVSPKPKDVKPSSGLNPFGSSDEDDDEETRPVPVKRKTKQKVIEAPKVNLNPFWSDGEEPSSEDERSDRRTSTEEKPPVPKPRTVIGVSPQPSPRPRKSVMGDNGDKFGSVSSLSSLNSSTGGTTQRKKKPAPTPPRAQDLFLGVPGTPTVQSANSSRASSPSPSTGHSPKMPRLRKKSRPPPPPPCSLTFSEAKLIVSDPAASSELEGEKNKKEVANRNRQSQALSNLSPESPSEQQLSVGPNKSTFGQWKRKKGPAPPRPVPQRRQIKAIPMKDVKRELDDIEVKQQELERQGVSLEKTIREKFEQQPNSDNSSLTPDVEDLVLQLFELVNEKNELFRRQAELMYLDINESETTPTECSISDYRSFCKNRRPSRDPPISAYLREKTGYFPTAFKKHHP